MDFAYKLWLPIRITPNINGQEKLESPLLVKPDEEVCDIKLSGTGLKEGYVGQSNLILVQYKLDKGLNQIPDTTFTFDGPSQPKVNFHYSKGERFHLLYIWYRVNEPGNYALRVDYSGASVNGSPFHIKVRGKEDCANAMKVKVKGDGLKQLIAGKKAEFKLTTQYSGDGDLEINISSETKVQLSFVKSGSCYKIRYTPPRAGYYFISIKFNGFHINGSPFRAQCISSCPVITNAGGSKSPELPNNVGIPCRREWVFV